MMARFHIVENQTVTNIILADTKQIAEQVTGFQAIASEDDSVAGSSVGAKLDSHLGIYVNEEILPGAEQ